MTQTYKYDGSPLSNVKRESVSFTEVADMGRTGDASLVIEDAGGATEIVGHKSLRSEQSDCSTVTTFRGFVTPRDYGRGDTMMIDADREITVNGVDLNAKFGFKVLRGRDWRKRPRNETVGERLTDLLASGFLALSDNGFVQYPDHELDKADLRGQHPGDILNDMAEEVGYNFFAYWDESAGEASLWFQDSNTSTDYSSTLKISNEFSDVNLTTVFPPSQDTKLSRNPERVVSGVWMPFKKGNVYRTRAATEETFEPRDGTAPQANTKRRRRARNKADRFLRHHKTEEDRITTSIRLPASKVNLVRAGQRIECKFTHYATEGYGDYTWFRVMERTVTQPLNDDNTYDVALTLSPQEDGGCSGSVDDISLVQSKMANHPSATTITFDSTPTVGNMMVLAVGHRDESALGPLPSGITGWTKAAAGLDPVFARDASGGLGHADLWYRVVESGDTGVDVGSDCMKILMEFEGVTELLSFAGQDESGVNDDNVSITSGTLGTPGLAVAAIITRQEDTGRHTTSDNSIPGAGAAPPSTGVGHDCLYVLWGTTSGDPVTLAMVQTGATEDPDGYWWGGRLAAFAVCS